MIRSRRVMTMLAVVFVTVACTGRTVGRNVSPGEVHQELSSGAGRPLIVDVREPFEFQQGHIAGAKLAPLGGVEAALSTTDRNADIVLVCRSGNRSGQAQRRLAARGYTNLRNMRGGMLEWEKRGLPVVKP